MPVCYTIFRKREGKPTKPERVKTMKQTYENRHIEYGTGDITVVYIVNDDNREDIIAMPVLFTENRFAMAWEADALVAMK